MARSYDYDSRLRIYVATGHESIDYSDGEEAERHLLSSLKSATDVSSSSPELVRHIVGWASEYHFSPARGNLLRFLEFRPEHRILELGCGCGAITRFLGETGATVVAVEGSSRRAAIAAERCRDLPNVRICCDHLAAFETDELFDHVTLIGVLEYAPRYISGDDPIKACLERAASFLKPDGFLVVAIENQLGLKYFNGCDEDHIGKPYYGLHGLYRPDEPTTLGRATLREKSAAAGLPQQRFFYPFPDYKLPQVVLSDTASTMPEFDVAALLSRTVSDNAEGGFHPSFHENLAWRPVIENGLLPHLANSFLVVAGRHEAALEKLDPTFLASAYTPDRLPRYATETIFRKSADGGISVEKKLMYPDAAANVSPPPIAGGTLLHRIETVADYVPGELYIVELQRRMARGEGLDAVIDWARDWLELVKAACMEDSALLPGRWLDAIPQNFIRDTDKRLVSIDEEWSLSRPLPLAWVIFRGMMNALSACPASKALQDSSLLDVICQTGASSGFDLDAAAIRLACELEAELRAVVYGETREAALDRLHRHLSQPPQSGIGGLTYREIAERQREALEGEIRRVKSTVSWQVTKPLRALWNIPRRFAMRLAGRQQKGLG